MADHTTTDAVAVTSGFLVKPNTWSLEANHRYLKGTVKTVSPEGDEEFGITQDDLTAAENFAWRTIISRMIGFFDTSTWSTAPPQPLYEIWDLLASAYVVSLVGQRKNIEDISAISTHDKWQAQASGMMRDIVNPEIEGERLYLVKSDGAIQHKRVRVAIPKVVSTTGTVFFPTAKTHTDAWGQSYKGSVQEFIDLHCRKIGT